MGANVCAEKLLDRMLVVSYIMCIFAVGFLGKGGFMKPQPFGKGVN